MTDGQPNPIRLYIDLRLAVERLDTALQLLGDLPDELPAAVRISARLAHGWLSVARADARKQADELRRTDPLLSRELSE